jgi:hypothetical protein
LYKFNWIYVPEGSGPTWQITTFESGEAAMHPVPSNGVAMTSVPGAGRLMMPPMPSQWLGVWFATTHWTMQSCEDAPPVPLDAEDDASLELSDDDSLDDSPEPVETVSPLSVVECAVDELVSPPADEVDFCVDELSPAPPTDAVEGRWPPEPSSSPSGRKSWQPESETMTKANGKAFFIYDLLPPKAD